MTSGSYLLANSPPCFFLPLNTSGPQHLSTLSFHHTTIDYERDRSYDFEIKNKQLQDHKDSKEAVEEFRQVCMHHDQNVLGSQTSRAPVTSLLMKRRHITNIPTRNIMEPFGGRTVSNTNHVLDPVLRHSEGGPEDANTHHFVKYLAKKSYRLFPFEIKDTYRGGGGTAAAGDW